MKVMEECEKRAAMEFCDVLTAAIDQLVRLRKNVQADFEVSSRMHIPTSAQAVELVRRLWPDREALEAIDLGYESNLTAADKGQWIGGWRPTVIALVRQNVCDRLERCIGNAESFLKSGMSNPSRPPWHE